MKRPKKILFFVVVGAFLVLFSLIVGIFTRGWHEDYKVEQERQKNLEIATETLNRLEEEARADIYGGATPEETLQLFIEALEQEDFELASKYFVLDVAGQTTRAEWKEGLEKAKEENRLDEIIDILKRAVPDPEAAIGSNYHVFAVRDDNGAVIADIDLQLNTYSGVWKIESL